MVKLHYIGKVYSIKQFEKEALKFGVSRAIPLHFLKSIVNFGDLILLAQWNYVETRIVDIEKEDSKQFGDAIVFGYFVVSGLNLPAEITEKILPKLNVKEVKESSGSGVVERGCGSYEVGAVAIIDNNMKEIFDAVKELDEKVKVFITGEYHSIDPHIEIEDIGFNRTFLEIDTKLFDSQTIEKIENQIQFIENYNRIKYKSKKKKNNNQTHAEMDLDHWLSGGLD